MGAREEQSMECSVFERKGKNRRKMHSSFNKGEKRYIGRTAEDKRIGFPDGLWLLGIIV